MLTVEQVDRDRAADAVKTYRGCKDNDWQQRIRDGKCDDGEMVQAFAAHRIAGEQAGRVAALEEAARVVEGYAFPATSSAQHMASSRATLIAAAIRALKGPTDG